MGSTTDNVSRDFHQAVRQNDRKRVQQLLREGFDPNDPDWSNNGRPAILEAAYRGQSGMVRDLLQAGADPNLRNLAGETALHNAFHPKSFSLELVNLLLDHGADVDARERLSGYTPLHLAARLCASGCDRGARRDRLEALRALCRKADPSLTSARKETALHRLTSGSADWTEPVLVLLEAGCPIDAQNDLGETALVCAIDRGHCGIAEALVGRGARADLRDRHRQTALHRCVQRNLLRAAGAILLSGCDPNAQDLNGDAPLHIAAGKGLAEMAALLLSRPGTDARLQNARGCTPLQGAVEGGFAGVVGMLLGGWYLDADCEKCLLRALDAAEEGFVRGRHPEILPLLREALEQRRDLWDEGETAL